MAGAYALATYQLGGYGLCVNKKDPTRILQCARTTLGMGFGQIVEVATYASHAPRSSPGLGHELLLGGHSPLG